MEKTNYFVHPQAICESQAIGENSRIWAFSHVMAGARIGNDCNIGENVFVENDVTIGNQCTIKNGVQVWDKVRLADGVFVGPNVTFTNDLRPRAFIRRGAESFLPTEVGRGATLGANSTIVCGIKIGEYAFIGAGAVVTKDIPAHSLVLGSPGRIVGSVCYCAEPLSGRYCNRCERHIEENTPEFAAERFSDSRRTCGRPVS